MQEINYNNWKNDIANKLASLKTKIDQNEIAKSLYGGFYVWDSKFIENPEIMFIGINPGNGNPNNSGKVITERTFTLQEMTSFACRTTPPLLHDVYKRDHKPNMLAPKNMTLLFLGAK